MKTTWACVETMACKSECGKEKLSGQEGKESKAFTAVTVHHHPQKSGPETCRKRTQHPPQCEKNSPLVDTQYTWHGHEHDQHKKVSSSFSEV